MNRISEEEYIRFIKEEINNVVKIQEELDIDVLVHGEPEVWSWYLLFIQWFNEGFFLVYKYDPKL